MRRVKRCQQVHPPHRRRAHRRTAVERSRSVASPPAGPTPRAGSQQPNVVGAERALPHRRGLTYRVNDANTTTRRTSVLQEVALRQGDGDRPVPVPSSEGGSVPPAVIVAPSTDPSSQCRCMDPPPSSEPRSYTTRRDATHGGRWLRTWRTPKCPNRHRAIPHVGRSGSTPRPRRPRPAAATTARPPDQAAAGAVCR